jgi:hypothetical protein
MRAVPRKPVQGLFWAKECSVIKKSLHGCSARQAIDKSANGSLLHRTLRTAAGTTMALHPVKFIQPKSTTLQFFLEEAK